MHADNNLMMSRAAWSQ